jgi:hypothetical protein
MNDCARAQMGTRERNAQLRANGLTSKQIARAPGTIVG